MTFRERRLVYISGTAAIRGGGELEGSRAGTSITDHDGKYSGTDR